ncbi:MAG: radical SAM protein [Kiritimatiellae bacterium]|nr:radical SAM protein [Kiritimatiellia bacterium]
MTVAYGVKGGVYVNMTNRCPCSCMFCLRNNAEGVYGSGSLWLEREPTVEETIEALKPWLEKGVDEVVFCGYGEPTERLDDMLAVASWVKAANPSMRTRVNTNGLSDLINGRPTAAEFVGKIDVLSISLNTDDAREYLEECHPKFGIDSYEAMKKFASDAAKAGIDVVMTVVGEPVTSRAKQERCREIAESLGARLRVRPYEG